MGAEPGDQPADEVARSSVRPAGTASDPTPATAMISDPGSPSPADVTVTVAPAPPATVTVLAVGARVGRFSILGKLGAGGMGIVYAAYDPELDRRIAIKLLRHGGGASREASLRLMREAQAMARLSHPNVVSVYDVGELDSRTMFIAMELVDGLTLDEWLAAEPRTWRQIRDVLLHAGRGLAAAHQSGLVHRDFKPANVLVGADGRARVTDFGIARLDDGDPGSIANASDDTHPSGVTPLAIELTRTGAAVGTPAYMAPEQHRGQVVDARADQFAFAVTAWQAVYGERPFEGSGTELLRAIEQGAVRPPVEGRGAPPWIVPVLRRALVDAPGDRWPKLDAMLERLAEDPALRRRQRIALAAALVIVALLAFGASYLASNRERDVCDVDDQELADTWNPEARSAIQTAFQATASPLAADHVARVSRHLDRWSQAWKRGRRDACESHVSHAQSDDLYDRRVACLLRQRSRVHAFVELLRKPDAALVRESVMAAASLPLPEDCADVDALLAERALPADPMIRATVVGFRADLERANVVRTVGRYREAFELVTNISQRAKTVNYPPIEAELAFALAHLQGDLIDKDTEASLRKAADAAARARDSTLYARVWIQLVWEVGFRRARFDDAAPLRTLAWQAVRLAGSTPGLVAVLSSNEAAVDFTHGDVAAARTALDRAIAIIETKHGPRSIHLAGPLNLLALTVEGEQPAKAAAIYKRALAIIEETVSPNHPRCGAILGNLAGIEFGEGRFQESIALNKRAIAVTEAGFGADSPELGQSLNGLAQPLWALGRFDEAFELIDRARVLWEKKLGNEHPYIAIALANLGGLRREQKRCTEALPYLEQARVIQNKKLPADHPIRVLPLTFLGGCLVDLGKLAEAKPVLDEALRIAEAKGTEVGQAGVRFELARLLWETNADRRRAVTMAEQARTVIAADKGDQMQEAAGVRSGSQQITEWLAGKTAP
ncbi:MAG TPA: serine/threonine-protein kinase [Kofleriaceae bacterium]